MLLIDALSYHFSCMITLLRTEKDFFLHRAPDFDWDHLSCQNSWGSMTGYWLGPVHIGGKAKRRKIHISLIRASRPHPYDLFLLIILIPIILNLGQNRLLGAPRFAPKNK